MPSVLLLLQKTIRIYRRYVFLFLGYASWLLIPYSFVLAMNIAPIPQNMWWTAGFVILTFVTGLLWVWVAIILGKLTAAIDAGQEHIDLDRLQHAARRIIVPLLIVALLQWLAVVGGLLLFIIPGLIFFIWFAFAQLAVMLDEKQGTEALSFSRSLVTGRFFHAAWLMLGGPLFIILIYSTFLSLAIVLFASLTGVDPQTAITGANPPIWIQVLDMLVTTLILGPITLIYAVLVYRTLKHSRKHAPERVA